MIYNPLDYFYKSQIGAVCANSEITFRIKGDFMSVTFNCKKDGENYTYYKMDKREGYFEIKLSFSIGLYFYHFDCGNGKFISRNYEHVGEISDKAIDFQLTAYCEDFEVPDWIRGGIIYQIFPDRFFSSKKGKTLPEYKWLHENWDDIPVFLPNEQGEIVNNDFFGGDLQGISEKLDYIQSLGVTAIYLNPIFKSFSNHRYDTGDYMTIDELLGDSSDLEQLIKSAKQKGIRIILDGVFNHTGDDSLYFNKYNRYDSIGAYQDKNSRYYSWYNFNNYPNEYESWWGIKTLPAINESNADYIDYITGIDGVIEYYIKLGIGGWRLDVVDELPSEFVKKIRTAVKRNDNDAIIIGEVWEDVSNKVSYGKRREYLQGKELDSAMNYPLKNAMIEFVLNEDSYLLSHIIKEQIDHYPASVLHCLMNILSTHDTARIFSVVAGENIDGKSKTELANMHISKENIEPAKFRLKAISLLQFTLCGVPSIYYGDEVGMQGYADPLNRRTFPWGKEDKEILSWYKFLSSIRKNYSAFKFGDFEQVFIDKGVFIFERKDTTCEILICVNLSSNQYVFEFDGFMKELISNKKYYKKYELKEKTLAVFVKNKEK